MNCAAVVALQPLLAARRSGCDIDWLGLWKVCFCWGGVSKGNPLRWIGCPVLEQKPAAWPRQAGSSSVGWDPGAGVSASYPAAGRSTTQPAHGAAELLQASWLRSSLGFEGKDRVFCCFSRTWGSLAVGKVVGVILHCPRNTALRMGKLIRGRDREKESQRKGSHALWPP